MNVIRENFGNSSNDTGPDNNLLGHIITRDQVDELEKVAIHKANQAQANKAELKISPSTPGGYSIVNDDKGLTISKAGRPSLSNPKKLLITNEDERALLRASLSDQKNLRFLRYFIIPNEDIIFTMNEMGINRVALTP
jgi:hypothetical protein